jgi:hypothetical protein
MQSGVAGRMRHAIANPDKTSRIRRARAGFSVLEALVAAGVLGIALIALVKLHTSSMRGMKSSRDLGIAGDIALQLAEELAAQDQPTLNASTCFQAAGDAVGCRDITVRPHAFTNPKPGADCTWWVEDGLMKDGTGNPPLNRQNTLAAARASSLPYRIDTVIRPHTDTANYPNARLIDVFVCWTDEQGAVKEIQTSRVAGI